MEKLYNSHTTFFFCSLPPHRLNSISDNTLIILLIILSFFLPPPYISNNVRCILHIISNVSSHDLYSGFSSLQRSNCFNCFVLNLFIQLYISPPDDLFQLFFSLI